jgi:hypothetical protein
MSFPLPEMLGWGFPAIAAASGRSSQNELASYTTIPSTALHYNTQHCSTLQYPALPCRAVPCMNCPITGTWSPARRKQGMEPFARPAPILLLQGVLRPDQGNISISRIPRNKLAGSLPLFPGARPWDDDTPCPG